MAFITLREHRLEYTLIRVAEEAPTLVFLHEGLGSLAMWRDFPGQVAAATGCNALVYSRRGYGQSDSLPGPRQASYLHEEALEVLPGLLDQLQITRPILFGHSDGGSIALLHAAAAAQPPEAVIVLAPHVRVEAVTLQGVAEARQAFETTDFREKLGRYHADLQSAFWRWVEIWQHPDMRHWNIETYLPAISCPVLAIQGTQDTFGTMAQVERIQALARHVALIRLEGCSHWPHRDQPQAVIAAVQRFIASCQP
jgi:pimeloyl-ACP methyl ester carboxylesterase